LQERGLQYKTFYGRNLFQVLFSKVGSWPHPQTLNYAGKWKGLAGKNALAYYEKSEFTTVKCFITSNPGCKTFLIHNTVLMIKLERFQKLSSYEQTCGVCSEAEHSPHHPKVAGSSPMANIIKLFWHKLPH
jgi:hypothetical protein